jgi:hypothetical protein
MAAHRNDELWQLREIPPTTRHSPFAPTVYCLTTACLPRICVSRYITPSCPLTSHIVYPFLPKLLYQPSTTYRQPIRSTASTALLFCRLPLYRSIAYRQAQLPLSAYGLTSMDRLNGSPPERPVVQSVPSHYVSPSCPLTSSCIVYPSCSDRLPPTSSLFALPPSLFRCTARLFALPPLPPLPPLPLYRSIYRSTDKPSCY